MDILLTQVKLGQNGDNGYVNTATGNLSLQQDQVTVNQGKDVNLLRTYDSQGQVDGDNNDGWSLSVYRSVQLICGTVNNVGTIVTRTHGDGFVETFTYDASFGGYRCSQGRGASDYMLYNATNENWQCYSDDGGLG